MPFVSLSYVRSLDPLKQSDLQSTHMAVGYHPETQDKLYIPDTDRYAGTYIVGVQGSGKSGLLQNMIAADMRTGKSVIVIDPHGDLTQACVGVVPESRVAATYLLDMEDEAYPFGVNLFNTIGKTATSIAQAHTVERLLHVFEVLWPEVQSQQHLPRYLRAAALTFLANPGATLVDMHRFLLDASVRTSTLKNVTDETVRQFWQSQYDDLTPADRLRRVQPLIGRLEALFMGRSLVRNIVGQRRTTIDFRKAIEAQSLIFIKLPMKTLPQDARLIGTILLAQIHAAIFSFADLPEVKRPGASLYVDEFQHFATPDFAELLTEGRKFGARVAVAHQFRGQLPGFLRDSTMTARTKIAFQCTPEDGRELAHLFPSTEATVQPTDIEPHPVNHLLTYTPDDPVIQTFVETYLRPLQGHKRGNRVELNHFRYNWISGEQLPNLRVADPTLYLDGLLYQAMRTGDPSLPIPPQAVEGFANCGKGFYRQAVSLSPADTSLSARVRFPPALVMRTPGNTLRWKRRPKGSTEQLYHFLFHLRMVMKKLAAQPIGKATTPSVADVGKMLNSLPRRAAFVRSGDTVGVIYTDDTPQALLPGALRKRIEQVLRQTRQRYCHPRAEVERLIIPTAAKPTIQPVNRWHEVEP